MALGVRTGAVDDPRHAAHARACRVLSPPRDVAHHRHAVTWGWAVHLEVGGGERRVCIQLRMFVGSHRVHHCVCHDGASSPEPGESTLIIPGSPRLPNARQQRHNHLTPTMQLVLVPSTRQVGIDCLARRRAYTWRRTVGCGATKARAHLEVRRLRTESMRAVSRSSTDRCFGRHTGLEQKARLVRFLSLRAPDPDKVMSG